MKRKFLITLFAVTSGISMISCDEHTPPKLEFKIGAGLISSNDSVVKNTKYAVGIIASKTEDDLKTYNISVGYDGANSNTVSNFSIGNNVNRVDSIKTRNQSGTEKWSFTITDQDGNVASKSLTLFVK